jgi:hypothetical protein
LSHVTSQIGAGAMFLIIDIEIIFNTEVLTLYMIYLHATFHSPDPSGSLVTAVKPKARY